MESKRTTLLTVALLICAVSLAYTNSLWGSFQFDDFNVIVNNQRVHTWQAWLQDLQQGIRPLLKFTYTQNWTMGLGETGFHLTNVLIHLCNTLLVWQLSRRFVANLPALQAQSTLPFMAALLFAVHPVHTEAVTYICGRSSALMTLFYLSGLLFYIAGRAKNKQWYMHVLTPLCMLLALSVKETAVTFPFALMLWEIYNGGSVKTTIRSQWSSWALLLASAVFFLLHPGYLSMVETSGDFNSLGGNIATQLLAFVYLLRQWLLPLWLNIDPDLPVLHGFAGLLPHALVLLLVLVMLLLIFRRRPWLSFALAWAVLQLVPLYLFLPRLDVANDRQLYLVSWPLALAVVAELSLWLKPLAFRLGTGIVLISLMSVTVLRNQDYRNEITLWEATVKRSPEKARVQNNLGFAYMLAGRKEEARVAFNASLQFDPKYYRARYNLIRLNDEANRQER
jgi:hypothetical protein